MLLTSVMEQMKRLNASRRIWISSLMPKFSLSSFSKLSTCHIDLQVLFYEVIKTFDCTVLEGYRDQASQEKAFMDRKTTLQWPNGKHNSNPSNAVDVTPCPVNWEDKDRFYYFAG